jgi:hypothetical protein
VEQIARVVHQADQWKQEAPTLIGEVGIPFDMGNKKAYRTGDFSQQIMALDATMATLEANCASFTLWNYTSDNTNARGDGWNDEDLSLFSPDQVGDDASIYAGGRALQAALRPYARKVAGEPLSMSFNCRKKSFEFTFRHAAGVEAPTEIFIPAYHYPQGYAVTVSDGDYESDLAHQALLYRHTGGRQVHTIQVKPKE